MSEHQTKLAAGEIQFHQWCQPPLEPGEYNVEVTQTVTELADDPTSKGSYSSKFSFSVAGPRFALNPSEIYSVYPPKGQLGDFANSLPHVVFTRRTLPWERSIIPGPRKEGDKRPWMALLVFSAADFFPAKDFPESKARKVGELINPGANEGWVGPIFKLDPYEKFKLDPYESEDDLCTTIDLPWDLFQNVAPSCAPSWDDENYGPRDDLAYLAHVREVNTGNKETLSFLADGWFSVVLANRFPHPQPEQLLSAANLGDVGTLLTKLRSEADPVSKFLWNAFSESARGVFKDATSEPEKGGAQRQIAVLLDELNRIVRAKSIYEPSRFDKVKKSKTTDELINRMNETKRALQGSDVARLNQLLLEDTYPGEIVNSSPLAVENRAYLVSLEGLQDYLPGSGKPAAKKPVRLAVLSSWSFHCCEAFAFKASMNKLKVRLLAIPGLGDSAKTDAEKQVNYAWETGYTALNHSTRLGEKAVSWYRGPLVPLYLSKETKYHFLPAADAALRYSPLDGMMDVTYAAAFQLGRLLALQDRHFATALYAHRNSVRRQLNDVLGRKRLGELLGSSGKAESDIMGSYVQAMGGSQTPQNGKETWATLPSNGNAFKRKPDEKTKQPGETDKKTKQPGELQLTTDFDLKIPQTVCQWLARLVLLYRVPFTYLVADERMLPPDSMRFFYLNPGWLKCLLEGACSVGRSGSGDELVDEYLRDKFLDFAIEQSLEVRTKPQLITSNSAANPTVVTTLVPHGLKDKDEIVISGVSGSNADLNQEHTVTVLSSTTFSVPVDAIGYAGKGGSFVRSQPSDISVKQQAEPQLITSNSAANPTVLTTPVPHGLKDNDKIVISGVSGSNADLNQEHTVTVLSPTTFSVPVDAIGYAGKGGSFVRSQPSDIKVTQKAESPNWPLTGFLLRSPIVEGWQGLEMRAWKDSGESAQELLEPLRIDRLAPDIMLCIFNGTVHRIEVKQPPEGMHFGASPVSAVDGGGFARFHLRRLNDNPAHDEDDGVASGPGHQLTEASSKVSIPLRTKESRVVEVAQLATRLKEKLEALQARDAKQGFTSADFGVEMVESPGRAVFDVANPQETGAQ